MSYLSSFLGTNNQGYSAFRGSRANPQAPSQASKFNFDLYSSGDTSNGVISWQANQNDFASTFWYGVSVTCAMTGWEEVVGLGNACIETNSTVSFNTGETKSINTILFAARNGGSAIFNKTGAGNLNSVYNLGARCSHGNLTFLAFNTMSNLTTVTCSEISTNPIYSIDFRITNCALTAQSVENILVAADNGSPATLSFGGSINLSGGSSSGAGALTAAAAAARTSLIAKGCTVSLNP